MSRSMELIMTDGAEPIMYMFYDDPFKQKLKKNDFF